MLLRPPEFFSETLRAELRLGEKVETIDADAQTVKTNKGNVISYDKARHVPYEFSRSSLFLSVSFPLSAAISCLCCLPVVLCLLQLLLCTGSRVRRLDGIKGSNASGIFYLREMEDLEAMRKSLFSDANSHESLRHVIVGCSFIGVEIAAALKKIGVRDIVVVGRVRLCLLFALSIVSSLSPCLDCSTWRLSPLLWYLFFVFLFAPCSALSSHSL